MLKEAGGRTSSQSGLWHQSLLVLQRTESLLDQIPVPLANSITCATQ